MPSLLFSWDFYSGPPVRCCVQVERKTERIKQQRNVIETARDRRENTSSVRQQVRVAAHAHGKLSKLNPRTLSCVFVRFRTVLPIRSAQLAGTCRQGVGGGGGGRAARRNR